MARPLPRRRTPVEQAFRHLGRDIVTRLGGMDDPSRPGEFTLPRWESQYPDVIAAETRLIAYSLNVDHDERKFEGFHHHGWGTHPLDSIRIASYICSALLGDFHPRDVRVTADGALQFGVNIAIPSRKYVYMPLTTAWILEPGGLLRLSTAFVTSTNDEFDPSAQVEDEDSLDWKETVLKAASYGRQAPFEQVTRASPRLYIQRKGVANALTKRLVRERKDHGTFSRTPLGRALLVPLNDDSWSWAQACRAAAYAQVDLGLHGVRSKIGTWVD